MATKKKGKKAMKSKRLSNKKAKTTRSAQKKKTPKKSAAKKKRAVAANKAANFARQKTSGRSSSRQSAASEQATASRSAGQAGDLQGLRDIESADSESVDELLEEGNAFEADVVAGVQNADDNEEQEVHTHEVPEDDVPEEYLDKDS
jgi:hypothetical protein